MEVTQVSSDAVQLIFWAIVSGFLLSLMLRLIALMMGKW